MTRGVDQGNFVLPNASSSSGLRRPLFKAIALWNEPPAQIKLATNISNFLHALRTMP